MPPVRAKGEGCSGIVRQLHSTIGARTVPGYPDACHPLGFGDLLLRHELGDSAPNVDGILVAQEDVQRIPHLGDSVVRLRPYGWRAIAEP